MRADYTGGFNEVEVVSHKQLRLLDLYSQLSLVVVERYPVSRRSPSGQSIPLLDLPRISECMGGSVSSLLDPNRGRGVSHHYTFRPTPAWTLPVHAYPIFCVRTRSKEHKKMLIAGHHRPRWIYHPFIPFALPTVTGQYRIGDRCLLVRSGE